MKLQTYLEQGLEKYLIDNAKSIAALLVKRFFKDSFYYSLHKNEVLRGVKEKDAKGKTVLNIVIAAAKKMFEKG